LVGIGKEETRLGGSSSGRYGGVVLAVMKAETIFPFDIELNILRNAQGRARKE
jgi:hypothetical protein